MSVIVKNPIALSWKFPGVEGISTKGVEVTGWPESLPELTQDLVDQCESEYKAHCDSIAYKSERAGKYPEVGDQLDTIWKQFNQMRIDGTPLIQEADDMLGGILKVKKDHPKPK